MINRYPWRMARRAVRLRGSRAFDWACDNAMSSAPGAGRDYWRCVMANIIDLQRKQEETQ